MVLEFLQVLVTTIKSFAECYFQNKPPPVWGQVKASHSIQAFSKGSKSSKQMCCEFHGIGID